MSSQSRLKQVYHFLAHNKHIEDEPVWIPSIWNECGYSEVLDTKDGEIKVQFQPLCFIIFSTYLIYLVIIITPKIKTWTTVSFIQRLSATLPLGIIYMMGRFNRGHFFDL